MTSDVITAYHAPIESLTVTMLVALVFSLQIKQNVVGLCHYFYLPNVYIIKMGFSDCVQKSCVGTFGKHENWKNFCPIPRESRLVAIQLLYLSAIYGT